MTKFYSILIDILLVVIGLACVYTGYKRGFIAALLSFFSWIISFVLAIFLSGVISNFTYNNFVGPGVEKSISDTVGQSINFQSIKNGLDTQLNSMPKIIKDVVYESFPNLDKSIDEYISQGDNIPKKISENIVKPVVTTAISMICFCLLFIILIIVTSFIAKRFRGKIHIPVVGQINAVLGGAVGIIKGIIVMFLVVILCDIIISATNNNLPVLDKEVINNSYVYETISNLSPFNHINDVK